MNLINCKNCKHWDKNDHECMRMVEEDAFIYPDGRDARIQLEYLDDQGLQVTFKTGPDFGCVLGEKFK